MNRTLSRAQAAFSVVFAPMVGLAGIVGLAGMVGLAGSASADTYSLPLAGRDAVIGEIHTTKSNREDTLIDIARRYDIGQDEMSFANPNVSRWVPGDDTQIIIPSIFILPKAPRKGIVVNVGDLRLYYYPEPIPGGPLQIVTHPISIGRMDWHTPLGAATVAAKEKDPVWRPTPSIRAEHAAEGDPLPDFIPGGSPENPLGRFALRLSVPGYLIHGTDERKSLGIGMRVTHGCIRMYPEDIEKLYAQVEVKTPVYLVDQPVKAGWRDSSLYLEVHGKVNEDDEPLPLPTLEEVTRMVEEEAAGDASLDRNAIQRALTQHTGIPVVVGHTSSELPPARRNRE